MIDKLIVLPFQSYTFILLLLKNYFFLKKNKLIKANGQIMFAWDAYISILNQVIYTQQHFLIWIELSDQDIKMRPSFILLLLTLVIINSVMVCNGKKLLKMKYYRKTCSSVESIVRDITWRKVAENSSFAPKLLRLHYHDCFVRVCF